MSLQDWFIISTLLWQNWASWIRTSDCRDQNPVPYRLAIAQKGGYWDLNPGPSEPQSDALANCAIPTIYEIRQAQSQTCSKGFEPPTHGLEGRCSIQLSYEHIPQNYFVKQAILLLKRVMGIEPTYPAWKAGVLPLNYTRTYWKLYL